MRVTKLTTKNKTILIASDDWFDQLSDEQKREYIKQHPNSKYAHGHHTHKDDAKPKTTKTSKVENVDIKTTFKKEISELPPASRKFFETNQHLPDSDTRAGLAKHIRTKKHEIVDHLKHQVTEWKDGCTAIGKLASGHKLSENEKKALKALVIDAAVTSAAVAVTGGFGHGVALALKHTAFDVLKDTVLKTVIRSTAKSFGASSALTGLNLALETLASSPTKEEKILLNLVEQMAKYIEKGDIPKETWEKVIKDLSKKG